MIKRQESMVLSQYTELYELIIPKDNLLRRIMDLVDFSFVFEELREKYCPDTGRNAIDPVRLFKYLLLKSIYDLSDQDVVERSMYDMSFKYFLGMAPEEPVINPSTLTKFRKQRLKDVELLDMLIMKTMEIALEKEVITTRSIIVDATHTRARYALKSPMEILKDQSKNL
ncbi:transposase, partial [Bhargavaea ginsengi]|uniref:transposase n=1 Tax=Bhargavaea ginsengi TaxID=426757 RepID=UPI002041BF28